MTVERDVGIDHIHAILREWQDSRRNLYASVFDASGVQTCAGHVGSLDNDVAVISDSCAGVLIPYASAGDCSVTVLDHTTRSVTLTWRDGTSAFIVTRATRE